MSTTMDMAPERLSVDAPAIVARDLTKRFGAVTAVDGLSFEVHPGRVTGFLGPNGAGKSTTLRMILGLVRPTEGSGSVLGRPYDGLAAPMAAVGAVLETQSFHPLRSGRNHLRVLAAAGAIDDARVDEVLAMVDLTDAAGRKAGGYSLGMRQRLGLAAALLGDPQVLVLDEPGNGLDPQGIRWLRDLLRWFAGRGRAVFVSSHLLAEMDQLADDVIVIDRGRSVHQGSVRELTAATARVRVVSPDPEGLARVLRGAELSPIADGEAFTVGGVDTAQVGALALGAGIQISELSTTTLTLEDVFLELTERSAR
jgi:ABC-2 type transport system ATP-binding protein